MAFSGAYCGGSGTSRNLSARLSAVNALARFVHFERPAEMMWRYEHARIGGPDWMQLATQLIIVDIGALVAIRVRRAGDKKYYLYVSTAKLESLYGQVAIPGVEKKTFEWSLNIGVLKLGRKVESTDEPHEEDKLQTVVQELEAAGLVGTVDEPNEYIKGILPMRWGLLADAGRPGEEPPLVLFSCREDRLVVGLGGSSRHVKFNYGASSTGSRSATPFLVGHLLDGLGLATHGWYAVRTLDGDTDTEFQTFVAVMWPMSTS